MQKKYTFRDLVWGIEAYRRDCEENVELDALKEGTDYFIGTFGTFDEAARKYLELKDAGWEIVRFVVKPKAKDGDVRFTVTNSSVSILVDARAISRELSDALRKIKCVIEDLSPVG